MTTPSPITIGIDFGTTNTVVAVTLTTQCPYCIDSHSKRAAAAGASEAELAEAAWVATAIRAGGGFAHGRLGFKLSGAAHSHE